jgi:RNA polymerase sigma-70 factor (ECF subfamily)
LVHVVNHSASSRSARITPEDREDLVAQVFLTVVKDDMAVLRQFRGDSSLATYLTVVARRVVVRELIKSRGGGRSAEGRESRDDSGPEQRLSNREQVTRLLDELSGPEAEAVRMFHLDGKSYQEISSAIGLPENSVGPMLSRARRKMREHGADSAMS